MDGILLFITRIDIFDYTNFVYVGRIISFISINILRWDFLIVYLCLRIYLRVS